MHLIELLAKYVDNECVCWKIELGKCEARCPFYVAGQCRQEEAVKCATQVARKIAKVNEERKNWAEWMCKAKTEIDKHSCVDCSPVGRDPCSACSVTEIHDTYPFKESEVL